MGYSPLVSVIVAIYNIEPYIRRCVDSVLAQDYQQLEIILVDDGSTDQCPAICDAYAQKDTRIKVIHKQNGGLSDARNAGLNVATGEYIGYVDGDDWIEPGMYGSMVRSCVEQQAQIAVCRYNRYLEKPADGTEKQEALNQSGMQNEKNAEKISIPGKFCAIYEKMPWEEGVPTNRITCLSKREALENFISAHSQYQIHNSVWSKLYSKTVCREIRFPVGKNSEDIMYTTRTFSLADKVVFIDTPLYNYVCGRVGSIMNVGRFERRLAHEIPFWKEQETFLREMGESDLADRSAFYANRRIMAYYRDAVAYEKQNKADAGRYSKPLAETILQDRKKHRKIANASWVRKGDKMRTKLFLFSPKLFDFICGLYEDFRKGI